MPEFSGTTGYLFLRQGRKEMKEDQKMLSP
jgi:hypothetical protein